MSEIKKIAPYIQTSAKIKKIPPPKKEITRKVINTARQFMQTNWPGIKGAAVQTSIITSLWYAGFSYSSSLIGISLMISALVLTAASIPFHRLFMLKNLKEKISHNYQPINLDEISNKISNKNFPIVRDHNIMNGPLLMSDAFIPHPFKVVFMRTFQSKFVENLLLAHEVAHIEYNASEFLADKTVNRIFDALPLRSKLAFLKNSPNEFLFEFFSYYFFPSMVHNIHSLCFREKYYKEENVNWVEIREEDINIIKEEIRNYINRSKKRHNYVKI